MDDFAGFVRGVAVGDYDFEVTIGLVYQVGKETADVFGFVESGNANAEGHG